MISPSLTISPKPNPPTGMVPLNSAESLFTRKLKHHIGVVPDPVHAEKQGNYLERVSPGNRPHTETGCSRHKLWVLRRARERETDVCVWVYVVVGERAEGGSEEYSKNFFAPQKTRRKSAAEKETARFEVWGESLAGSLHQGFGEWASDTCAFQCVYTMFVHAGVSVGVCVSVCVSLSAYKQPGMAGLQRGLLCCLCFGG